MHAQAQPRLAKRMPCAVNVGARRYSGVVLNISQGGLFVQTNADPGRGACVELELNAPDRSEAIPLRATVVWRRAVPPQLRSVAQGGIGFKIQQADEFYYQLLARWMRSDAPRLDLSTRPAPAAARPALSSYRVRVRAIAGPRSRTLTIEASSLAEARAEALRYAGEDWRVLDVEEL